MTKKYSSSNLTKIIGLILLVNILSLVNTNAKIITKRFSLQTPFPMQENIDINEDGKSDLFFDAEYKIENIKYKQSCNLPGSYPFYINCFDTCTEFIIAQLYTLRSSNMNISLQRGDLYQGEESFYTSSFYRWPDSTLRKELVFYKSNYLRHQFTNENGVLCSPRYYKHDMMDDFFGQFIDSKKYIAFTILGKNGLKYYAWMRRVTFWQYEVAYENIPNHPIVVGSLYGMYNIGKYDNMIKGTVYEDADNDCSKSTLEKGVPNVLVKAVSNNQVYYTYTNSEGNYDLVIGDGINQVYTLSIESRNVDEFISQTCSSPTVRTSEMGSIYSNRNIGVKPISCASITLNLQTSSRRRCAQNINYVNYRNNQNRNENDFLVKVLLPEYVRPISSVPAWTSISGDTLFFSLGTLAANTSGQIKIIDSVICWNPSITGTTLCTKAWVSRGCVVAPYGWDQSEIKVTGNCFQNKNYWTISNKGEDMADSAEYRIFYDNVLVKKQSYKIPKGSNLKFQFPSEGHTIRVEADQSPNHPFISYAAAFIERCGVVHTNDIMKNIAHALPFPTTPSEAMSCRTVVDSYDPNDKNGYPTGFGDEHLVEKNTDLTYTIRFQNTGTADAYTVLLVDSLSQHLDPLNIELLASSHPYRFEYRARSTTVLMWIFDDINLTPESVDAEASQGFVTYRIKQKPNLSDGTVIQNKAYIYFDYNDAIITNTTVHTIGKPYTENILKVVREPEDQFLCKNDSAATLHTQVSGVGKLSYQWKRDGQNITDSNRDTLYLDKTQLLDEGYYFCLISNFLDTVQTSTVVVNKVWDNPVVEAQTSTTVLCQHERVVLSGVGALTYTWDSGVVDGEAFTPLTTNTYTVTGTDVNGCLGSSSVTIEVLESPLLEIVPPATECMGTAVDITTIYTDLANTEGIITYWKDAGAVQLLENPTAILEEGIYYIKKEANGCSDLQPVVVTFEDCQTTSIAGIPASQTISVFPNPSSDYIQIKGKEAGSFVYKIYSTTGVLVGSATTASHEISVVELPAGNYYLEIHQAQTVSRFRFNKQ